MFHTCLNTQLTHLSTAHVSVYTVTDSRLNLYSGMTDEECAHTMAISKHTLVIV